MDKKTPHNMDAEQGLLGALLVDNRAFARLPPNFSANAFFVPVHAKIFEAIRAKVSKGEVANPITLRGFFEHDAALFDLGGARYLVDLGVACATVVNTRDYAKTLMELALRRDVMAAASGLADAAATADLSWGVGDALVEFQKNMDASRGAFAEDAGKKDSLPLVFADDVAPILQTSDFVEDLLCEGQMSVIYGASNCGKTFFTMDLSLHIACGFAWRGKRVDKGGVIYCALEGGQGTNNRVAAFKEHHGVNSGIDLAIVPCSINLLCDDDIDALVESVRLAGERIGKVRLIVIDTLSRALSGGDENSSEDMGRLVIAADKLRAICLAHICFIHHSGKDKALGARGHSLVRAACDTELEIVRDEDLGVSRMEIVKQREMEKVDGVSFVLSRMVLGQDVRGKDITSCVVLPYEDSDSVGAGLSGRSGDAVAGLSPAQAFLYNSIIEALAKAQMIRVIEGVERTVVLRDVVMSEMTSRGDRSWNDLEAFKRSTAPVHKALERKGLIGFDRNHVWLL